ncbi:MAG: hypothetical protein IT385_03835 [Deltaproteobacteria bacterium]|nr:hypothetical protein [Deltaproteobacteria bacterium]
MTNARQRVTYPNLAPALPNLKGMTPAEIERELAPKIREVMGAQGDWIGDGDFPEQNYRQWMGQMDPVMQQGLKRAVRRANPDNLNHLMGLNIPPRPAVTEGMPQPSRTANAPPAGDPKRPKIEDKSGVKGKGQPKKGENALAKYGIEGDLPIPEVPVEKVVAIDREVDFHQKWQREMGAGPDGTVPFMKRLGLLSQVGFRSLAKGAIVGGVSGAVGLGIDMGVNAATKRLKIPGIGNVLGGGLTAYSWFKDGGAGAQQKVKAITEGWNNAIANASLDRPMGTIADFMSWFGTVIGTIGDVCSMLSAACYIVAGLGFLVSLIPGLQMVAAIISPCVTAGRVLGAISSLCGPVAMGTNLIATTLRAASILFEAAKPEDLSRELAAFEGELTGLTQQVTSAAVTSMGQQAVKNHQLKGSLPRTPEGNAQYQAQRGSIRRAGMDGVLKTFGVTRSLGPRGETQHHFLKDEREGLQKAWAERKVVHQRIQAMRDAMAEAEQKAVAQQMAKGRGTIASVPDPRMVIAATRARAGAGFSEIGGMYRDATRTVDTNMLKKEKQKGQGQQVYASDISQDDLRDTHVPNVRKNRGLKGRERRLYQQEQQRAQVARTARAEETTLRNDLGHKDQHGQDAYQRGNTSNAILGGFITRPEQNPGVLKRNAGVDSAMQLWGGIAQPGLKNMLTPEDKKKKEDPAAVERQKLEAFLGHKVTKAADVDVAAEADRISGFRKFAGYLADKGIAGAAGEGVWSLVDMGFTALNEQVGLGWVPSEKSMKFMAAKLQAPPADATWTHIETLQNEIADRDGAIHMIVSCLDVQSENAKKSDKNLTDLQKAEAMRVGAGERANSFFKAATADRDAKRVKGEAELAQATARMSGGDNAQLKGKFGTIRSILSTIKSGVDGVGRIPGLDTRGTSQNLGNMIKAIDAHGEGHKQSKKAEAEQKAESQKQGAGLQQAKTKTEHHALRLSNYGEFLAKHTRAEEDYQRYVKKESASLKAELRRVFTERQTRYASFDDKQNRFEKWGMEHYEARVAAGYGADVQPQSKAETQKEVAEAQVEVKKVRDEIVSHPGRQRAAEIKGK